MKTDPRIKRLRAMRNMLKTIVDELSTTDQDLMDTIVDEATHSVEDGISECISGLEDACGHFDNALALLE